MVNLLTLSFAAVALTPLAGAVPTTRDVASAPAPFSFAKWVDDIIAKPEEAATPQQALDAYYAYVNSTSTDNVLPETASKMHKRAMCNTVVGKQAPIPDAVECINYLARLNTQTCEVYRGTNHVSFVVRGNAEMIGVRPDTNGASTICNNVARAGGKIMDACSRADNTVEGEEITPDAAAIAVHIIQRGGY
ncbi:hypothetical protein GE21DRAFT_5608 [Neurospora crassa]|uniref:Ecp2 effector protein domain-containing protein n=1 Tax=Neurospora crassa (strain ATCC 24698 / 74-OR23-1A / CBS 708.71 / DSM 1257 / FGSC 987) TaxID=367110 RepID=Q7S9S6_NEUCR|nr:hypothetical protein NCU06589 [Neurospora crassa OR74A]EAA33095.1 hypothetical protein NCU06589 [Neurospora crassa OR74A]KHE84031.1 hypothetical protein GE21DRAFT_5608 [Neurospora crassa]|eukprot:XP_962331.1 hypothetical protein NCU06589 [Neurospora crassa OR74A]